MNCRLKFRYSDVEKVTEVSILPVVDRSQRDHKSENQKFSWRSWDKSCSEWGQFQLYENMNTARFGTDPIQNK